MTMRDGSRTAAFLAGDGDIDDFGAARVECRAVEPPVADTRVHAAQDELAELVGQTREQIVEHRRSAVAEASFEGAEVEEDRRAAEARVGCGPSPSSSRGRRSVLA